MTIWSKAYWLATSERCISTAAQSAILVIGADQLNVLTLDWQTLAGFAAGGAFLSLLKGLAANVVTGEGPSFTEAETVTTAQPCRALIDDKD